MTLAHLECAIVIGLREWPPFWYQSRCRSLFVRFKLLCCNRWLAYALRLKEHKIFHRFGRKAFAFKIGNDQSQSAYGSLLRNARGSEDK